MKIFENLVHDTYRNFIAANPNAAIRADFIRDRWNNRENTTAFLNEMAFIANYAEFIGKSNEGDEALKEGKRWKKRKKILLFLPILLILEGKGKKE